MLALKTTSRFQKDYKKSFKSGRDMSRLKHVMKLIAREEPLDQALRDHKLVGNYKERRECHLAGDWLLIYKLENIAVLFERTGSHLELFRK